MTIGENTTDMIIPNHQKDPNPHPEHKDSGVRWIGRVPTNWEIAPGFSCFKPKQQKNIGMQETQVLSLSYGRIIVKPSEKLHGLVPASFETYQIIDPGDIIIRPTDMQNDHVSLRVGLAKDRGIITSAYLCLQVTSQLIPEYAYLLLHAYDLMKVFYGMGSGLRQNLDYTDLRRMPVIIPPQEEQYAIVRFIDYLDKKIRQYILSRQRLIKLLNEQKQAIIQQAVTRGLDAGARMKPSGVEWLGDVPEHWDVTRIKYLLQEVDDRTDTGKETLFSLPVSGSCGTQKRF